MLEDTSAHSPLKKMFELADVYGVGYDEQRASRRPVRLGIIGCGGVAVSKHIPAIMRLKTIWEPVELVAVTRRNETVGKHIERMYGCRWYADHEAMLAKETLDGVLVLSPDNCHAEHTIASLEAGCAVLVEKPVARALVDSARMCRVADERRRRLMTVSNKRYSPPYLRAKRLVTEGPVRDPAMFVGKFNLGYDYIDLLEQGTIHLFDLTRHFMGDVAAVTAVGVNKYRRNRHYYPFDNAAMNVQFVSGSIGTLYTSATALSLKPWERIEIYAEKNWLAVEDQHELLLYDSETGPTKLWRAVMPNTLIFDEEFGGFMGLIENFLQVVRGEEEPFVTGWDGHAAYELAVAAHLALKRGERIAMPLDYEDADAECRAWLHPSA